ncbi:hypothetical protein P8452_56331 [Trifolium repens]|nr:hypothetical protein P8452_56331 [Trifolium repens]
MALATGIMIQMPMLRTPNYKSTTPIKPMTITCAHQDRYRGKQGQKDRRDAGKGRGPQINSISTTTSSRNLQLDNIYATNTLTDINDQDGKNKSPTSIGNIDYDYQI